MRLVVMGPSGCGKSTMGLAVADGLNARFIDGDDLHPDANVARMAAGIPLDDGHRRPWLAAVGAALVASERTVIACSALKRVYRDAIRRRAPQTFFAELSVPRRELERRMRQRGAHFMPTALLDSQLTTLESLQPDEAGVRVDGLADAGVTAAAIIEAARVWQRTLPSGSLLRAGTRAQSLR